MRLAGTRGTEEEDVGLVDLDLFLPPVDLDFGLRILQLPTLEVVVDRRRDRPLGLVLADDELVEVRLDLLRSLERLFLLLLLETPTLGAGFQLLGRRLDAAVADEGAIIGVRRDEVFHLVSGTLAKAATHDAHGRSLHRGRFKKVAGIDFRGM